ncbi:MAG: hypothetical protein N3A54_02355 [Patescibacteria group bacterium]|nr:hypothetical protein [Patescibacteria group bacterium]
MNRLLILDGNGLLHRAYHALPHLSSASGFPVGAVYGFISMVMKLYSDFCPDGFAVAFDRPEPTFRNQLFPEYQSHRPKAEPDFVLQIHKIHDVIKACGIPIFDASGYEADDVIGTLVKRLEQSVNQIIVVTGDRDILQLVNGETVLIYMPVKGLSEGRLYGEQEVKDKLGVFPKQIPDWKALCGDSSDNYPGVFGIGPKTAATLITRYGSLEGVYEHIQDGNISENIRQKLLQGRENAMLSKQLATIRTDTPLDIQYEHFSSFSFQTPVVRSIFEELGFSSFIKKLFEAKRSEEKLEERENKKQNKKQEDDQQMSLF